MLKVYLTLAGLVLAIAALLVGATPASAQEPTVTVSTNAPLPLVIDGVETQQLPASIEVGARVSITEALHYATENERWVFQGWSHGPTSESVTLTEPGVYTALYSHEVLLHIRSTASGLYRSMWVLHGTPVEIEAPEVVEQGERVRYRFLEWSDGETPFSPINTIAPLTPMVLEGALEANYVREYLLAVEGPSGIELTGSGWYSDGTQLVLQAPDVVEGEGEGERLKFVSWESVGRPSLVTEGAQKPVFTINVDAPYTLKAVYEKQYFVVASAPFGFLKREWVKEGADLVLEAVPVEETVPEQVRYVFKRWVGGEGLVSPRIGAVVSGPVNLSALYDVQVMVTVDAPYGGSGGGWYEVGSTVTISVPDHLQSKLIFKKSFVGFPGYASGKSTVQILVQEPIVITAIYTTGVDIGILSLLLLAPLAAVLLYLASRWGLPLMRRRVRQE